MADLSADDLGLLLVCSLRYAMGRRSYITALIAEKIEAHFSNLSASDRVVILRDLRQSLQHAEGAGRMLGDAMDDKVWRDLLVKLEAMPCTA